MRISELMPTSASIVNFGAMSCTESCVATLLNLTGCDYRYFFLDYWNLFYEARTLLAGRNLNSVDLDFLFGVSKERRKGISLEECARIADDPDRCVLLLTRASRLPFFPKKLLGFEENGFEHFVLLHNYDALNQGFRVVDPIAGFAGTVSLDELRDTGPNQACHEAFVLTRTLDFQPPSPKDLLSYVGKRNYIRSLLSESAFRLVLRDVDRLADRPDAERKKWIEQNNIAITSIVKNRRLVWHSFVALGILNDEQRSRFEPKVQSIISEWTGLNLLLFKWARTKGESLLTGSIRNKIQSIQAAEKSFLSAMNIEGSG